MIANLLIRHEPHYRRDAFEKGLRALGYEIGGMPRAIPGKHDVLVIWNRYAHNDTLAKRFETVGASVLVAENGPLGRTFQGQPWYAVTRSNPVACGDWTEGAADRWDSLGVKICDWRKSGKEIIVLAQRGIGPPGVGQPEGWHQRAARALQRRGHQNVRIREHPGERPQPVTLEEDIENASCVVTWASGAAFKALLYGVPVFYGCEKWVGRSAADPLGMGDKLTPSWPNRLPTFKRLAWCMWRIPEIERGDPFRALLESGSGG